METQVILDTLWVLIAAFLVFFMNLGFATVEGGFVRAKNNVNIMSKNFIVFACAFVSYWVIGFGLMFGDGTPFVGLQGLWLIKGVDNSPATGAAYQGVYSALNWTGVPLLAKFLFQVVFAGTAATIVSGVVAERIKYYSFIFFSFFLVAVVYPICGHWIWGGGWLQKLGFWDFAGSTQVHSIGGWAGLAGALVLGERFGKYGKDGSINAIPGHNMPLAMIGTFVLWFGWFGFNPGSTMSTSNPGLIAHICITTCLSACTAILSATVTSTVLMKKPDIGMCINGCLAGLVAITAPCAFVSVESAAVIGLTAGCLVVIAVIAFDRARIDDPVGALSVHLVNGIFGTLAVGLFSEDQIQPGTTGNGLLFGGGASLLTHQLIGVAAVAVFAFVVCGAFWLFLKYTMGIRVSLKEEIEGLDIGEHGNVAYSDFVSRKFSDIFRTSSSTIGGLDIPDEAAIVRSAQSREFEKGSSQIQKIEAIIRPERLGVVKAALEKVGYPGIMITEVDGHGKEKGISQTWRGESYKVDLIPKVKIEIVAERHKVDKIVNAIVEHAITGAAGDGKIFIYDMHGVVRIRTKEQGTVAVG